MTIKGLNAKSINTGLICKFTAIITGNCLKQQFPISTEITAQALQAFYGFGGCLIAWLQNNFCTRLSLCQNKNAFIFSLLFTYHAIKFPMAESFTVFNIR